MLKYVWTKFEILTPYISWDTVHFVEILTIYPKIASALLWLLYRLYMGKNNFWENLSKRVLWCFYDDSSGNRTPGSRFYSDLLGTSVCIHQHVLKRVQALGCSHNCRRLTHGSFQLTHMSRDDTLFNWSSHGGQNEDRTLLQRSQRCHKGEFRHVSISARQQSLRRGHNLCKPFLRATLAMTVGSCARAMADTGRQKGS